MMRLLKFKGTFKGEGDKQSIALTLTIRAYLGISITRSGVAHQVIHQPQEAISLLGNDPKALSSS